MKGIETMDKENISHAVNIIERKSITLTGVKKIDSFSSTEFFMDTMLGPLTIKGNDLEIIKLDTYQGTVSIKGLVNSIMYKEDKKQSQESMLSKLFK